MVEGKYRNIVGRIVKVTEKTIFFRYMGEDGEEVEVRKNKTAVEIVKQKYKRDILYYFGKQKGGDEDRKEKAVVIEDEDESDLEK